MVSDIARKSISMPRQTVRQAADRSDRNGLGNRAQTAGGATGGLGAQGAPHASTGLGDAQSAFDLARLAQRYAMAAQSAARKLG